MHASPDQLAKLTIFGEFNQQENQTLIELADPLVFAAGATIVRQDESGDAMYILVRGEADVTHRRGDCEVHLAKLKPGDFFGELALVDEGPRSATVTATSECLLLKVPQSVLRALAGVYPNAAFKMLYAIAKVLVTRMRAGNARYIDSLLAGGGAKG